MTGQLQYHPRHPDLNECLARADAERPEIKAREKEVEIEDRQADLDRSALRPQVEAFSGYEVYNERDPSIGREFNHGYVVGLNARWHIFDGFATRGKLQATRARRDAAAQALAATRLSVASEVRSAFLDLQQADHILQSETKNVQTADESLEIAKGKLERGIGNAARYFAGCVRRDAHADDAAKRDLSTQCGAGEAGSRLRRFAGGARFLAEKATGNAAAKKGNDIVDLARPPKKLTQR